MRGIWAESLGIAIGLCLGTVWAGEIQWRPAGQTPAPAAPAPIAAARPPAAMLGQPVPAASLGKPVPLAGFSPFPATDQPSSQPKAIAVSYGTPTAIPPAVIRAAAPDDPPPFGSPPPPYDYGGGVPPSGSGGGFWGWVDGGYHRIVGGVTGVFETKGEHHPFQSDHALWVDAFTSPVSSPFLLEDPRSLTEVRPIFIYQGMPSKSGIHGGDIEFAGLQARVALTDQFSFVFNKLGFIWDDWNSPYPPSHVGFAELDLGPKFTFLRSEDTRTLGAVGVTFQIPAGDSKVLQDTGTLSIAPYVSIAQNFGRSSYGSFNAMGTLGYAASIDTRQKRLSLHRPPSGL